MSVAQQALKELDIKVDQYYASEIDKYAVAVTQSNYPNTIQLGSITEADRWNLPPIDLLCGGSPCQDLSIAKQDRQGLSGRRSGLFWDFVNLRNRIKPKYFILENVASMSKEARATISEAVGCEPVMINASLVSAQNRKRLFWVCKWGGEKYIGIDIPQPEDKGIMLKDIILDGATEMDKSLCVDASYYKGSSLEHYNSKSTRQLIFVGGVEGSRLWLKDGKGLSRNFPQGQRVYSPDGKGATLSANGGGMGAKTGLYAVAQRGRHIVNGKRKDILGAKTKQRIEVEQSDKAHTITSVQKDSMVLFVKENTKRGYAEATIGDSIDISYQNSKTRRGRVGRGKVNGIMTSDNKVIVTQDFVVRKLHPIECLRLQSMPDDYFDKAIVNNKPISNTQRYKMCGNAFNCQVIQWILRHLQW